MTGMQGVYLVAAELTKRGMIVSPTSRGSFGADLLVTDAKCKKAWSVQVKTNYARPKFWLLNKNSKKTASTSHVYVLVNLGQATEKQPRSPPDFYIVSSRVISEYMFIGTAKTGTRFPVISLKDVVEYKDKWTVFGKIEAV